MLTIRTVVFNAFHKLGTVLLWHKHNKILNSSLFYCASMDGHFSGRKYSVLGVMYFVRCAGNHTDD